MTLMKAQILRARWMYDAERFEMDAIHKGFKEAVSLAQKLVRTHLTSASTHSGIACLAGKVRIFISANFMINGSHA